MMLKGQLLDRAGSQLQPSPGWAIRLGQHGDHIEFLR